MKLNFTLLLFSLVLSSTIFGNVHDSLPSTLSLVQKGDPSAAGSQATPFRIRCGSSRLGPEPLLVIDGEPATKEKLNQIAVEDIDSIFILKNAQSLALYGSMGVNGVIIVKTKRKSRDSFLVKDARNGEVISGATVRFSSAQHSLVAITDGEGKINTSMLHQDLSYQAEVSSLGYRHSLAVIRRGSTSDILLEPISKELDPVVVKATGRTISCSFRVCYLTDTLRCLFRTTVNDSTRSLNEEKNPALHRFSIFPNPVQRGQQVNIQWDAAHEGTLALRISMLNGAVVSTMSYPSVKGNNRIGLPINPSWTAGIYLVEISQGTLKRTERILVR